MTVDIRCGDALTLDESVQTCVTSPPYWKLRSYLPDDDPLKSLEIGHERTPEEYVARLVEVFREVRRVLKEDSTLWIVIGDSYAGSWGAQSRQAPPSSASTLRGNGHIGGGPKIKGMSATQIKANPTRTHTGSIPEGSDLKPKDLVGVPWMLAFALRADGWYLRAENIWNKPNAMPSSVTDRTTRSHEQVFHLSKSDRYFYDQEAIFEPFSDSVKKRPETNVFCGDRPEIGGTGHMNDRRSGTRKQDTRGVLSGVHRAHGHWPEWTFRPRRGEWDAAKRS